MEKQIYIRNLYITSLGMFFFARIKNRVELLPFEVEVDF
jgi:hypothetical protein